jgi:hypothetical protein
MAIAPRELLMCPVCRNPVDPGRAFLDDGGAYHRPCAETGPICALCSRTVAPGSATTRVGEAGFHARCYRLLLIGAGQ